MRTLLITTLALLCSCQQQQSPSGGSARFYIGTTDGSLNKPIVLCTLDLNDGSISVTDSFGGARSPSYLALSPGRKYLYAVNNEYAGSGRNSHQVSAFSVDAGTGALEPLNSQPSEGRGPCHISVHPNGRYVFTANYNSGTITVHPVNADGSLAPATDIKQHTGSGPDTTRQQSPHAHFIRADPQGRHILAVDLGIDKVMNYSFDAESGRLSPNPQQAFYQVTPGSGPRHLDFHPSGRYLYLLNEMAGTLIACDYEPATGIIATINTVSTLEEGFTGFNKSSAVRVHPGGKFVYASNRGDSNSITACEITGQGAARVVQIQDSNINFPRDFNIDPSGKYLLAANQHGNSITVFEIDPETGILELTDNEIPVSEPCCIVFLDE